MNFLLYLGKPGAWIFHRYQRHKLRNRSLSIVSNNCWGGFMHRYYNFPFNSPFIGLYITAPHYISLLENKSRLYAPLSFISHNPYPVAQLPTGELIHFLHYKSAAEAAEKWNKRLKRLDWNNCLVKFSDNDECTPGLIKRFDELPFRNKVCFTAGEFPELKSVIHIPRFKGKRHVKSCWKFSDRYFNFIATANKCREL